jgi:hypothetical protein
MAVRRCKKADLKRIAKATGGKLTIEINLISICLLFSNIINCFG